MLGKGMYPVKQKVKAITDLTLGTSIYEVRHVSYK